MTKTCGKCGTEKPYSEFHTNSRSRDGLQVNCKVCHIAVQRRFRYENADRINARDRAARRSMSPAVRETHREMRKRHLRRFRKECPEKNRAHWAVYDAVRRGRLLKPDKCTQCGDGRFVLHAHHEDYSRKLDVQWLCPKCHKVADTRRRERAAETATAEQTGTP